MLTEGAGTRGAPGPDAEDLARAYADRTTRSRQLHHSYCAVMPAGQTRSIVYFDPYPVVLAEGDGPVVRDVDGNEYLDVLNNYTSLVHGHRFPAITHAVGQALEIGTVFPAPHRSQLDLAELLQQRYPAAERIRFTNSGSEATALALRIARAATGRRSVVAFTGGYHGSVPELADGGPELVRIPYNDAAAAEDVVDSSVAAVVAEPFLGSGGVVPADPGFLERVSARSAAVGALFILDEVQSLRNHVHGVHGALGLSPDLVTVGKIVGGGFPVGAVLGREALIGLTDPRHPAALAHSGTFNGNVVTTAAGAASLRALDEPAITLLNARAASLAAGIEAAAVECGVAASVTRAGSIMQVHLRPGCPRAAVDLGPEERRALAALHLALLVEGVYAAPRGMLNLSTVISDEQLAEVVAGYGRAFWRIRSRAAGLACAGDER